MDETGCFYRALPDKSLSEKAKKCKGGKKSKEWLTVAFFVSATGERRKPVVIGKYANPRCLKNINKDDLPCQYLNQQKAWMTSDILHKLLSQLNSSFKAQNRSILLFIDSAGCHPYDLKGRYSNIKLVFFPVNCTSKLQPLDLGIIQNFKVHYRKLLLRHIITMITDHDSATDIAKTLDVLQAIRWMGTAWSKVENDTIIKCFAAAGISSTFSEAATVSTETGEEDPFADLDVLADEELGNLVQQVAPGSGISAYLESDNELPTCYSLLNEQQLLEAIGTSHDVMEIESDDENEMEKEDTPGEGERSNETTTLKSFKDVLDSVPNISAFLIHRGEFKVANEFSLLVDKVGEVAVQRRSTQSRLERYFKAM
nr:tigger transposable element-derived protein 6-like [Pocillopora verrucosa]